MWRKCDIFGETDEIIGVVSDSRLNLYEDKIHIVFSHYPGLKAPRHQEDANGFGMSTPQSILL
ncbi:Uncharacterised protein [uncultured archaeon]|nr:Uncharacterised protein [uncultured archaeon]